MNALPLLPGVIQAFNAAVAVIRRVRVTVHTGYLPPSPEKFVFINVVNKSPSREIEIVAVWFEGKRRMPVLEPSRPLPKPLRPDESWETWGGVRCGKGDSGEASLQRRAGPPIDG
jgi:hypothetical protein